MKCVLCYTPINVFLLVKWTFNDIWHLQNFRHFHNATVLIFSCLTYLFKLGTMSRTCWAGFTFSFNIHVSIICVCPWDTKMQRCLGSTVRSQLRTVAEIQVRISTNVTGCRNSTATQTIDSNHSDIMQTTFNFSKTLKNN